MEHTFRSSVLFLRCLYIGLDCLWTEYALESYRQRLDFYKQDLQRHRGDCCLHRNICSGSAIDMTMSSQKDESMETIEASKDWSAKAVSGRLWRFLWQQGFAIMSD